MLYYIYFTAYWVNRWDHFVPTFTTVVQARCHSSRLYTSSYPKYRAYDSYTSSTYTYYLLIFISYRRIIMFKITCPQIQPIVSNAPPTGTILVNIKVLLPIKKLSNAGKLWRWFEIIMWLVICRNVFQILKIFWVKNLAHLWNFFMIGQSCVNFLPKVSMFTISLT